MKLKLTSQDRDNFKAQSMAEHLRYEKMKIIAKDERRKRISLEKELSRTNKRSKKSKPLKKRGRKRPVEISDSSDDSSSSSSAEGSTIESIKLSKKFRSSNVATKPSEASK